MLKKIILLISLTSAFMFSSASYAYEENTSCVTSTLIGGIIGGLLGHQLGGGSGKDILTGAGAILGGSVGNDECQKANKQPVRVYPTPVYPTPVYPIPVYPAPVWGDRLGYSGYSCQVKSQVYSDGYGGHYTQWQEICN